MTNIPVFPDTQVALKGKKGLIVGIANDQSIAWGVRQGISGVGRRARSDVSERSREEACRAAC
jgi:enoyl-[acyl-carrier protein] reductase I